MSKKYNTAIAEIATLRETLSKFKTQRETLAARHEKETQDLALLQAEESASLREATREIVRRLENIALIERNLSHKLFEPGLAQSYRADRATTWTTELSKLTPDFTLIRIEEGERDQIRILFENQEGEHFCVRTKKSKLLGSTWDIAKLIRSEIRAYKDAAIAAESTDLDRRIESIARMLGEWQVTLDLMNVEAASLRKKQEKRARAVK